MHDELRLCLDSPAASVTVESRLFALSDRKTKLISDDLHVRVLLARFLALSREAPSSVHIGVVWKHFKRLVESHVAAHQRAAADAR